MTNAFGLSKVKKIIAISSCKGGVGKSTITVALAKIWQKQGLTVGILDADVYGPCVHALLGVDKIPPVTMDEFKMLQPPTVAGFKMLSFSFLAGDQPVLLRGPIVTRYLQQMLFNASWGELDVLIIDMPPGTGDVAITIAQSIKLTGVIIITTPQALSQEVVKRGIAMFDHLKVPMLGLIDNMSYFECDGCTKKHLMRDVESQKQLLSLNLPVLAEIPVLFNADVEKYLSSIRIP